MQKRDWDEECGVFGAIDPSGEVSDIARTTYYGIFSLQHRGQESAGIAVCQGGTVICHKAPGLVTEVFDDVTLHAMQGYAAIGHVRFPSSDASGLDSVQPMHIKTKSGFMSIATNGSIMNAPEIREMLKREGAIFQTTADFEVLLALIAKYRISSQTIEDALLKMMNEIKGAYSIVMMLDDRIIGIRDPLGIRPLVMGKNAEGMYFLASETCAIDAVGATYIRDILPGEIVSITRNGVYSRYFTDKDIARANGHLCIFEFVYFARPDSIMDGASVYESRYNTGRTLAIEAPCDCDLVIAAPDSGVAAAIGFSEESGVPYGSALLKNRYVGRTFIQSTQIQRELSVKLKFSVLKSVVEGKRLLIVDDSIIRGTTTKHTISLLRDAGAKEVHMRVASPPVRFPCFYGVSTSEPNELTASHSSVEDVRIMINADSLSYVSLDGLKKSTKGICTGHCASCFDGEFPAGIPEKHKEMIHRISW
mgnify:CR=1 FL=1